MRENQAYIPEGWILTNFGDKNLFEVLGSGIERFDGEKDYYSTSSIDNEKLIAIEQLITFKNRPSRANMQPRTKSVWFAKMKNTLKIICPNQYQIKNVIFSTGFCGIKTDAVDCSYLMQILKSEYFNSEKDNLAEGTTQVAVNNEKIKKINILLPASIVEQQKIASILSKLDTAIEQTEQLIEKYKRIKIGLMHDLLTHGIDENGNIRSEETHKFKDSPLGRIPIEWECELIGDVCYVTKLSGFEFTKYMEYRDDGEIIAIRAMNIKNEQLILEDVQRISKKVSDFLVRSKLYAGDILITYIGAYIGDILQINENNKYHLAPNVAKIVAGNKLTTDFLEFMLRSANSQRFINSLVTTTANPSLTMGQIRTVYITYPKNKDEQNVISERLQTLNENIKKTTVELGKLQLQKSGLMHDLLTGKVRVSNYEEQKEPISTVNSIPFKTKAHNQHIEDAVLIAAIVNAFYSDKYPLGRKKIQKLLYLVRRHQEANVACFKKKAAGPYADEVRYKGGEPIANKNKYIATKTSKAGTVFSKGVNIENALAYIEQWNMQADVAWLTQFKYTKVDRLELIATIDMARCDLEKENIPVSLSTVKHLIATNEEWKKKLEKSYFDDFCIQNGINESYKLFGEYK